MYNIGPFYKQDSMYYKTANQRINLFNEIISDEVGYSFSLPVRKEVCSICKGEGTIANRSIDGSGLDPNDPDLDHEFWQQYRSGAYNVICDECNGLRVVDSVDEDAMKSEMFERWVSFNNEIDIDIAMNITELRMGA